MNEIKRTSFNLLSEEKKIIWNEDGILLIPFLIMSVRSNTSNQFLSLKFIIQTLKRAVKNHTSESQSPLPM